MFHFIKYHIVRDLSRRTPLNVSYDVIMLYHNT